MLHPRQGLGEDDKMISDLLLSLDWFTIPMIRFFFAVTLSAKKYPVLQKSCTIWT